MREYYERTINLIGEDNLKILQQSHVAIFGVGGVGSFAAEAVARAGVGTVTIIDGDVIDKTNINRQLLATIDNIGEPKTRVMGKRLRSVAPFIRANEIQGFYPNIEVDLTDFDFIIDAIDSVAAKTELIVNASRLNIPIISSMGAGNRLRPELFEVSDIYKTSIDPLARVMRKKLKSLGIKSLPVVYSKEIPLETADKNMIGSISFTPGTAGMIAAGFAIRNLINV